MNYENQVVKHNYSLFIFKYKDKLALNREYLVSWNLRYTFIDFIRFLPWCVLPNMFIYIDGFSDDCIWRTGTDQHWSRLCHSRDRYRFSLTFWAPSLWSNLHRKSSFRSNFLPWVLPTNVNDWLHPEKVWCESIPFSNLNPIYLYLFCLNFYLRLFKRLYQHSRTNYNREWT